MEHEPNKTAVDENGTVWEYIENQWRIQPQAVGSVEAAAISAGSVLTNLGRGVADLAAAPLPDSLVGDFRKELTQNKENEQQFFGQLEREQPIATGVGGVLPYLATAPLSGGLVAQAGIGGALGGLGLGTFEERVQNAALGAGGALAGGAIFKGGQRVASRFGVRSAERAANAISKSAQNISNRRAQLRFTPVNSGSTAGAQQVPGSIVGSGSNTTARTLLQNAGRQIGGEGQESLAGQQALARGKELGITFEPGAKSGNIATKQLLASAKRSPIFSDVIQESITRKNNTTFNKLALKALGDEGTEFTNSTIARVESRLSDTRDAIIKRNPKIVVDDKALVGFEKVLDDFVKNPSVLGTNDPTFRRIEKLKDLVGFQGNKITSKQYMQFRTDMRSLQRSLKRGTEIKSVGDSIDVLDNLFARNVSGADKAAFDKTTQQFRLLTAIEKPGVLSTDQVLRPGALGRNLSKNFKTEFSRDNQFDSLSKEFKDLFDATKVFNQFPNLISDSGTATNLSLGNIFKDPLGTATQVTARPLLRRLIESAQP